VTRLVKGMYGGFKDASDLFGIREGRCLSDDYCHNAGWYNKAGEKLGWGDLRLDDMQRIACNLEEGELFIILGEQDSFWKHVERIDGPASMGMVKVDKEAEMDPGKEHVIKTARFAIAPGKVYALPSKYPSHEDKSGPVLLGDHRSSATCEAERISREKFKELMTSAS